MAEGRLGLGVRQALAVTTLMLSPGLHLEAELPTLLHQPRFHHLIQRPPPKLQQAFARPSHQPDRVPRMLWQVAQEAYIELRPQQRKRSQSQRLSPRQRLKLPPLKATLARRTPRGCASTH